MRDAGRYEVLAEKSHRLGHGHKDEDYYVARAGNKLNALLMKLNAGQVDGCDIRAKHAKSFSNMRVYDLEMANETPNLGAASDVLRLEILIKQGGIYMDVDLGYKRALPDPLQVREDLALFGLYDDLRPCNALIAACAGSELLKKCRASIKESYKRLDIDAELESAYDRSMRGFTVSHTGPTVVSSAARAAEDKAVKKAKGGASRWNAVGGGQRPLSRWLHRLVHARGRGAQVALSTSSQVMRGAGGPGATGGWRTLREELAALVDGLDVSPRVRRSAWRAPGPPRGTRHRRTRHARLRSVEHRGRAWGLLP
jgi:hypothetical protein